MTRLMYLLCCAFAIAQFQVGAQSVPISMPVHDQLVQGPCHIFSTIAAMESKAIQGGCDNPNFMEWNLYSDDVLGGSGGGSQLMVEGVIGAASSVGLYERGDAPSIPTLASQLPNPNDLVVAGIARFQGNCNPDMRQEMYSMTSDQLNCYDDENNQFLLLPFFGTPLKYEYSDGAGYVVDNTPTESEMQAQLQAGNGLIAVFERWNDRIAPSRRPTNHSVFIYRKSGNSWSYKDSWPGNPGNKTMTLPPPCEGGDTATCLSKFYYLTGEFSCKADCSGTIRGRSEVNGNTTYTLQQTSADDINWSVSNNLIIVSQSGNSITVAPNGCVSGTATITAIFNDGECEETRTVTLAGQPSAPTDILVFSPDWNNGNTCTNTTLELNVVDNNTNGVTYDWNITGATINGSNTNGPVIFVTTNGGDNVPLTFKVRAIREGCPPTAFATITGTAMDCGGNGGGQLVSSGDGQITLQLPKNIVPNTNLQYAIYGINGGLLDRGQITDNPATIDLPNSAPQMIVIHLFDPSTGFERLVKHVRMR